MAVDWIISGSERKYVLELMKEGILRSFNGRDFREDAENGGVAVCCGDGDANEKFSYHVSAISPRRPHAVKLFGGPLMLNPHFRGYDDGLARGIMQNIGLGMHVKKTSSLFLYYHYPCGMARIFGYGLDELVSLVRDSRDHMEDVLRSSVANTGNIHVFLHMARINRIGKVENNTYLIP